MGLVVPITKTSPSPQAQNQPIPPPVFLAMATAQTHAAGRLLNPDPDPAAGPPMDITSQAQKAEMQKTAKDWPEGTSPEVRNTFDKALKSGDITREQYNKAMRDPRQFQEDQ